MAALLALVCAPQLPPKSITLYPTAASACSYAAVPNPFQEESAAILAWRGNVWAWCYGLLSDPPATLPTLAEFRASLLAAWPMP